MLRVRGWDVQLQLERARLGADDVKEGGRLGGAGGGHIEPLAVLGAGDPHQRPVQGDALAAVAGAGIAEVDGRRPGLPRIHQAGRWSR